MMGVACRFDKRQHRVLRSCVADAIGRVSPGRTRGTLFLYRHKWTGNYVVGQWADTGKRSFYDVLNLGPAISDGKAGEKLAEQFKYCKTPLWKELREVESERVHRQQDEGSALTDEWEWRRARDQRCRVALSR